MRQINREEFGAEGNAHRGPMVRTPKERMDSEEHPAMRL